ncbi:SNF5 / SMARCB1 / INI1 domain containing protein [Amanita muscaria]|uniref:SNF5-domain-containing protein n=1 Tax=Amanita muscaria (strain Koide BX008) TaxID=946122 RepID=A0A0C2SX25_AMAMK|nr:hypothetical protein M378DRAFT_73050 [Amanita muscaria Koide BX008]
MSEQGQTTPGSTYQPYSSMTDVQFKYNLAQLQNTVASVTGYVSPTPQPAHSKAYMKNLQTWSSTATPPPKSYTTSARTTRARAGRASNLSNTPTTAPIYAPPPVYQPPPVLLQPTVPPPPPNPPRPPLPTVPQALQSSYSSRMRTGVSLLMQPVMASTSAATTRTSTRRGGVVNYADPGSGDDLPDAGAIDSDDSDFVASGGTRTSIRQGRTRMGSGMLVFNSAGVAVAASTPGRSSTPRLDKAEIDQSYLGMVPPGRFIKSRPIVPTSHEYPSPDVVEKQALRRTALVPIRVEFETDTHRVRDCFVWNINETTITPENFAKIFCGDLDLPLLPWADTVANQIRAQLEEHEGVASMEMGLDGAADLDTVPPNGEDMHECRVILSIDVQIANYHLMDHIEWDLLSPLTPEAFAQRLCLEAGLSGEAIPLVAHAIHEELMKHKKDAIEWGVIGGDLGVGDETNTAGERAKGGWGVVKDKTGLGLNWGRAPKDGRGPKTLKSVWRDWAEAEEFRTKFEELTAEEVEKREVERERASRRLRRETSKFQTTRNRRR